MVVEVQALGAEPRCSSTSEPMPSTDQVRDARRRHRRAWAQGAPARVAPGQDVAGPQAWSVDVVTIERARTLRGWSRRELARHAHVDPGTLGDLLGRRRRPTFGTLQAICTALGLTLAEVIVFGSE